MPDPWTAALTALALAFFAVGVAVFSRLYRIQDERRRAGPDDARPRRGA